jgi:hypothetical protein
MRRKNLLRGLKKKKTRLPFHGKAEGGTARPRADRLASFRKPGPPGDVEPINPNTPNAPPDGAVRQKFQGGGAVKALPAPTPKPALEKPDVARDVVRGVESIGRNPGRPYQAGGAIPPGFRARSFNAPRPPWTDSEQEFTRHPSKEWGYGGTGKRATDSEEERPALPNVELERPSVKELDLDLRPSVKEVGPPKRKAGGWIAGARESMERRGTVGSLRKAMGAKEGQKIPTSSLQAKKAQAERTGNTKMMRKVNFALNVRK